MPRDWHHPRLSWSASRDAVVEREPIPDHLLQPSCLININQHITVKGALLTTISTSSAAAISEKQPKRLILQCLVQIEYPGSLAFSSKQDCKFHRAARSAKTRQSLNDIYTTTHAATGEANSDRLTFIDNDQPVGRYVTTYVN